MSLNPARQARGRAAQSGGVTAERLACDALVRDGWTRVLAQRLRTAAGEIDIAAERDGVLALVEVKSRATLGAAAAVLPRQRARLLAAGEIILAEHPAWGRNGIGRFRRDRRSAGRANPSRPRRLPASNRPSPSCAGRPSVRKRRSRARAAPKAAHASGTSNCASAVVG